MNSIIKKTTVRKSHLDSNSGESSSLLLVHTNTIELTWVTVDWNGLHCMPTSTGGCRFLLKKKTELNTSHSSARLLEEVMAIEKDENNHLVHCTTVVNNHFLIYPFVTGSLNGSFETSSFGLTAFNIISSLFFNFSHCSIITLWESHTVRNHHVFGLGG